MTPMASNAFVRFVADALEPRDRASRRSRAASAARADRGHRRLLDAEVRRGRAAGRLGGSPPRRRAVLGQPGLDDRSVGSAVESSPAINVTNPWSSAMSVPSSPRGGADDRVATTARCRDARCRCSRRLRIGPASGSQRRAPPASPRHATTCSAAAPIAATFSSTPASGSYATQGGQALRRRVRVGTTCDRSCR